MPLSILRNPTPSLLALKNIPLRRTLWCFTLTLFDGWPLNGHFFRLAQFSYDMKHANTTRWLANPNWGHDRFSHMFWSSYEHLIVVKVKIFVLIPWSHRSPPVLLHVEIRRVIIFWVYSLLKVCFFGYPLLEPCQITYHSNICVLDKKNIFE